MYAQAASAIFQALAAQQNARGVRSQVRERGARLEAESARQAGMRGEMLGALEQSRAPFTFDAQQGGLAATQGRLQQSFAPRPMDTDAALPMASPVADLIRARMQVGRDAAARDATNLGALRGYEQQGVDNGFTIARNARATQMIGDRMRGSASILPVELSAAQYAGGRNRANADALDGVGRLLMAYGLTRGGANTPKPDPNYWW